MIGGSRGVATGVALLMAALVGTSAPWARADAADAKGATDDGARRQRVLVKFTGGQITVGDVEDAIANKAPHLRREYLERPARERLVREMVDYELLLAEARRRGYADHPRVRDARATIAGDLLQAEVVAAVPAPSAEEIASYHEAHKDRFSRESMRRASFVELASQAEAQALADRARNMELEAFRRLAAELDPRRRGGELGYVDQHGRPGATPGAPPVGGILAAVTPIAFQLGELGDVSDPVPHDGAFLVVRLTGRTRAFGERPEGMEERIRESMVAERSVQAVEQLVSSLRAQHPVETRPGLLAGVVVEVPAREIPTGFPAAPPDPTAPTVVAESDGV